MDSIRGVFFEECDEHIAALENGLGDLRDGGADPETVNVIFRAVHSIKGSAGLFGFDGLVAFAHDFETALDALRQGRLEADNANLRVMLSAADVLADLVQVSRDGGSVAGERVEGARTALTGICQDGADSGALDELLDFQPVAVSLDISQPDAGPELREVRIELRPYRGLFAKANDPIALAGELARLGELSVELDDSGLPALDDLSPEESYLSWTFALRTDCEPSDIREVFEFVEDDCDLDILDPRAMADAQIESEAVASSPVTPVAETQPPTEPANVGETVTPRAQAPSIRVDLTRIDRLIDLASELVISHAMVAQQVSALGLSPHSEINGRLDELGQLTREIQDGVMGVRAQPVKAVFQRMGRLVREVEAATGKQVELVTRGEETEVDRSIIEQLADPLTHMIRNAIDHGLETPAARVAAGKPETGTVTLSAAHRAGRIVIEVSDDGAGVDRARIREVAEARGVVAPGAELTDEETDNLIFAPGFSTAESISDLSGRGVGMDVVRSTVQKMGGRMTLRSEPGEGAVFTLSMPLTLAVMDGMLVSVGGQAIVAPLSNLVESLKPKPEDIRRLGATASVLAVRGVNAPIVELDEALGYAAGPRADERIALLVEDEAGDLAALMVDQIHGQRQVVIKSLEKNYAQIPGIAGATILGDGQVALILDVPGLLGRWRHGGQSVEAA